MTQLTSPPASGKLYLVSMGIGDIDHMTLRAHKTITSADVIVGLPFLREKLGSLIDNKQQADAYHGLFTPLAFRHADADEVARRESAARVLIRGAVAEGKTVVILDYGDPTVFGPQMGYVKEFADLAPVIVPGLSSLNVANAALGRPILNLTSASLQVCALDGLQDKGASPAAMVFFTMRMDIEALIQQLSPYYPDDTPVALVLYAGFSGQEQCIHASLATLRAKTAGLTLPWEYLVYVGDVLAQ
jgi:precorrin-4/cobalt-precorrin-4 C11-methyltransferase